MFLNLFSLVAGPTIERQQLSLKFTLNITRYQKNTAAVFMYTISRIMSDKKSRTRAQMKDIKQNFLITYYLFIIYKSKYLCWIFQTPFSRATTFNGTKLQFRINRKIKTEAVGNVPKDSSREQIAYLGRRVCR